MFAQTRGFRQSKYIVDPKRVTQIHSLWGLAVAVVPKQNPDRRPMSVD